MLPRLDLAPDQRRGRHGEGSIDRHCISRRERSDGEVRWKKVASSPTDLAFIIYSPPPTTITTAIIINKHKPWTTHTARTDIFLPRNEAHPQPPAFLQRCP